MPLPKAIAFDLDSTLAVSKSPVTPVMGALLARLAARVPIAVMSGGKWAQFEIQVLSALPSDADKANFYFFPVCAGYCYHYEDGAWTRVDDNSLTDDEKREVYTALDEAMKETGFDQLPDKIWGERIEDRGALIAFSGLGQEAPWEAKKAWDPTREKREPLQKALVVRLPGFEVRTNASTTIDITRKGISKAYGARKFSELTGIPVGDMLYIGDALFPGGNDEIVKESGIPTRQVTDPDDTAKVIEELLAQV